MLLELGLHELFCQCREALIDLHDHEEVLCGLAMALCIAPRDGRVPYEGNRQQATVQNHSHHTILPGTRIPQEGGEYPSREVEEANLSLTLCMGSYQHGTGNSRFLVHSLGYFSREWRTLRETVQPVAQLAGTEGTYLERPNIPAHEYHKIGRKRLFAIFTFFHRCLSSGWRADYTPFGGACRAPSPNKTSRFHPLGSQGNKRSYFPDKNFDCATFSYSVLPFRICGKVSGYRRFNASIILG